MGILEKFCKLSGLTYPIKGVIDSDIECVVEHLVCDTLLDDFINKDIEDAIVNKSVYNTLTKPMPFGVFKTLSCTDTYLAIETILVNTVVDKFKECNRIETGYDVLGYLGYFKTVLGDYYTDELLEYTSRFLVFSLLLDVLLETDDTDFDNEDSCNAEGRFVLVGRDKEYILANMERILTFYFENSTDEVANLNDVVLNICEVVKNVK